MPATYEESHILLLPASPIDEKWALQQDELVNSCKGQEHTHSHCCSSNGKRRNSAVKAGIIALVGLLITFGGLVALTVCCPGVQSLLKRQTNNETSSPYINDHWWIIVACVGGIAQFSNRI